MIEVTSYLKLD